MYIKYLKVAARWLLYALGAVIALLILGLSILYLTSTARNDRDWTVDQAVLPYAEFNGDLVTIHNIRNFTYRSTTDYTPAYYDKTFKISGLTSVDFIVEPLRPKYVAHTFVSFGFTDGSYVAVSAEIRKEKGESFSPLKGLLDRYELMYVIADERDVIRLRALHRKDEVNLYPVNVSKEHAQQLFVSMLTRANTLAEKPEFYNTLTNTCTTNIVDHINEIAPGTLPWDLRIVLPRDSDIYAYELGLIDTTEPLETLRANSKINDLVKQYENDPEFSQKIRGN
jgi:hypothetical protein